MEEEKKDFESLIFVIESPYSSRQKKPDIKACKIADGSKQRTYNGYNKSDGSSQTMVTGSIFMTGVIDTKEKREVVVLGIVNGFLKAYDDETITMMLSGKLAKIMVRIGPALYLNVRLSL